VQPVVTLTIHGLSEEQASEFADCYGKLGFKTTLTVDYPTEHSIPIESHMDAMVPFYSDDTCDIYYKPLEI
jgi:hypothetical protein